MDRQVRSLGTLKAGMPKEARSVVDQQKIDRAHELMAEVGQLLGTVNQEADPRVGEMPGQRETGPRVNDMPGQDWGRPQRLSYNYQGQAESESDRSDDDDDFAPLPYPRQAGAGTVGHPTRRERGKAFEGIPEPMYEPEPYYHRERPRRRHDNRRQPALRDLPRGLTYDGRSNWKSFELKFTHYAKALEWSEEDCKVCLLHCLTGKALDCCARMMRVNENIPYRTLLRKLQERFGAELQVSAQVKFNQATQGKTESLEDWADRVQELAAEAFRGLPEHYANSQAIGRFCQGLLDVPAGHSAFMKVHATIEQAMNDIRLFQYSKAEMVGRRSRSVKVPNTATDYDEVDVCAVAPQSSQDSEIAKLQQQMDELKVMLQKLGEKGTGKKAQKTSTSKRTCFLCDQEGHFVKDCPLKKDLNSHGSA